LIRQSRYNRNCTKESKNPTELCSPEESGHFCGRKLSTVKTTRRKFIQFKETATLLRQSWEDRGIQKIISKEHESISWETCITHSGFSRVLT